MSVVEGQGDGRRWHAGMHIDPCRYRYRNLPSLLLWRPVWGHSREPPRQHRLEERSQVWTASDDDPSAYLGNCPHQTGPYTIYHIATISYFCERAYTQAADNDVAGTPLVKMARPFGCKSSDSNPNAKMAVIAIL